MKQTLHMMNHFMNLSFQLGKLFCTNAPLDQIKAAHDVAGDLLAERVADSRVPALWLVVFCVMLWIKCSWLITKLLADVIKDVVTGR